MQIPAKHVTINSMLRVMYLSLFVTLLFPPVFAQEAADLTQHIIRNADRSHDFKTVTKGTIPEHRFVLKNPFQEPMHVARITSSCLCTTPDFNQHQSTLDTYEEAAIVARFRGDMFEGPKNAALTVVIDRPFNAEILLNVKGDIRGDLKITPDRVDFYEVAAGKEAAAKLTVTYTGPNSMWKITDAKSSKDFLRTSISSEPFQLGRRVFHVGVTLGKSAPQGELSEQLVLISNDIEGRREIPVFVRAVVGTTVSVSPQVLFLGQVPEGEPAPIKNVVVKSSRPFRITKIESDNPALTIPFNISGEMPAKTMYMLPIEYKNPAEGEGAPKDGMLQAVVKITTDMPNVTAEFSVTMRVQPLAP